MKEEKLNNRPQKYSKISLEKRKKLVNLVVYQGFSISGAARRLGLKNSTSKLIIRKYKKGEAFFESKQMREERIKKQKEEEERRGVQNRPEIQQNTQNAVLQMQTFFLTFPCEYQAIQTAWNYSPMFFSYAFAPMN